MWMMIKLYLITLVTFFAIDLVWLGLVAKNFYQKELGFIMKASPNWPAALIFYLVFIFGLVYFVLNPALEAESLSRALVNGLIFGFITYATYDLTNLATLENWPLKVTIIDLIWGTSLGGGVSVVSYILFQKIT